MAVDAIASLRDLPCAALGVALGPRSAAMADGFRRRSGFSSGPFHCRRPEMARLRIGGNEVVGFDSRWC
jgi:hypothetical protein